MEIDSELICRICLETKTNLKSIFLNEIVNGTIIRFNEILDKTLDIVADSADGMPSKICGDCKIEVKNFYVLKLKSMKNEQLLRKILNVPETVVVHEEEIFEQEEGEEELAQNFKEKLDHDEGLDHYLILKTSEESQSHDLDDNQIDVVLEQVLRGAPPEVPDVFECGICGQQFNNEDLLGQHFAQHTKETERDEFEVIEKDHVENVVITEPVIKQDKSICSVCSLSLKNAETNERHSKIHTLIFSHFIRNSTFYACSTCGFTASDYNSLLTHLTQSRIQCTKSHLFAKTVVMQLNLAKYNLEDVKAPRIYVIERTKDKKEIFKCCICTEKIVDFGTLVKHCQEEHGNKENLELSSFFKCGLCGTVLLNGLDIRIHFYTEHRKVKANKTYSLTFLYLIILY